MSEAIEVGAKTSVQTIAPAPQRRGAKLPMQTISGLLRADISEIGGQSARKSQNTRAPKPRRSRKSDAAPVQPAAADRREAKRSLNARGILPLAATISELVELQKARTHCIKSQSRADRSCEAFIARSIGFSTDLSESERKKIFARAKAMRRAIEKGGQSSSEHQSVDAAPDDGESQTGSANHDVRAFSVVDFIVLNSASSRKAWDELRKRTEARMCALARTLPVWPFVMTVKGFAELGLAAMVGETGDLSGYATKERVWKRLGLAVFEGRRQGRRTDPEEAKIHGYSPRRRSEIWAFCSDAMFRHQWAGDKDEDGKNPNDSGKPVAVAAHATGPYGEVYAARRAATSERDWSPAHCHNDARRIMTKALVADIWAAWHKALAA